MAPDMTTKDVPLAGVIGDPVGHSLSPKLHGHWLKRYGLRGHYVPMRVAQSDLVQVLRTLPLMGFKGVNVTIPHKEHVLSLADSVTDRAALIGAANTLTFTSQGRIQADNTDGSGFISSIRQSDSGMDGCPGACGRPGKRWRGEGRSSGRCSTMARRWCMWRTGPVPARTG
jgi:shikimate dehydrogenase